MIRCKQHSKSLFSLPTGICKEGVTSAAEHIVMHRRARLTRHEGATRTRSDSQDKQTLSNVFFSSGGDGGCSRGLACPVKCPWRRRCARARGGGPGVSSPLPCQFARIPAAQVASHRGEATSTFKRCVCVCRECVCASPLN